MDVSDILRDRVQEPDGLQRMVLVSLGLHVVLVAILFVAPDGWFSAGRQETRTVMTITLGGGAPGPSNTGMTPLSGRPVQVAQPLEAPEPRRPEPVRPPAARTPEMVIPRENAAPSRNTTTAPRVTQAPPESRGNKPTTGPEERPGQAIATGPGAATPFGGLASGGGQGGTGVRLDVANFCCPEYIATMVERIRANWNQRAEVRAQAEVKVTIQRNGTLTDATIERSSGFQGLDLNALRAIALTKQLPPLPAAFTNPTLTVYLTFDYQR